MWIEELKKEIKVKLTIIYRKKRSNATGSLDDGSAETKKVFYIKVRLILGSSRAHRKALKRTKTTSYSE